MSSFRFCFLAERAKGLVTLEHEGQRFVPVFERTEDLQRLGQSNPEQFSGYHLYIAAAPAEIEGFLGLLRELSLHVGIATGPSDGDDASISFAIMEPDVMARAILQP